MIKTLALLLLVPLCATAAEQSVEYSVRGLFQPDRKDALITAARALESCRLLEVHYESARAVFIYDDEAQGFKKAGPEQVLQQINNQIRKLTNATITLQQPDTLREDQLQRIEFTVEGLDCLGCSYGLYSAVASLEGVERAYASFRDGKLTAFIDPSKTSRQNLAAVLKKKEIKFIDTATSEEPNPGN